MLRALAPLLFALSVPAQAQVDWYVDDDGTPPGTGTLIDPYTSIQYALDQPTTMDGDTLIVAEGTYAENVDFLGKAVTIDGSAAATRPVLAAPGGSAVTFARGEGQDSVLRGLEITGGTGTPTAGGTAGGGVFIDGASPRLVELLVRGNSADLGGGLAVLDGALVALEDCDVEDNTAITAGALYVEDAALDAVDGRFRGNRAENGLSDTARAGAVGVFDTGSFTALGTLFDDNRSECNGGGALWVDATSYTHVGECNFIDNRPGTFACTGSGGAILSLGTLVALRCNFETNGGLDLAAGGAIEGGAGSGGKYRECSFQGNRAQFGGAVHDANVFVSSFENNIAEQDGSGQGGAAHGGTLTRCILQGNRAFEAGGAAYGSHLDECQVIGNVAYESPSFSASGGGLASGSAVETLFAWNVADSADALPVSRGGGAADSTLDGCVLMGNRADRGGAADGGLLTGCDLAGNEARDAGGGAYGVALVDCTVRLNKLSDTVSSPDDGGGGAMLGSATDTVFQGNVAPGKPGGGVKGTDMTRCVLTGNLADTGAGAWYSTGDTAVHCSLVNNHAAATGGGLSFVGGGSLKNSIVWANTPDAIDDVLFSGTIDYSDVEGGWLFGTGNIDADPLLFGPAGGDAHLGSGSPCIGTGEAGSDMGAFPFDGGWTGGVGSYCGNKPYEQADPVPVTGDRLCVPRAVVVGTPTLSGPDDFGVNAEGVAPEKSGVAFHGTAPALASVYGGLRCVGGATKRMPIQASPGCDACGGTFEQPFSQAYLLGLGFLPGDRIYVQYWFRAGGGDVGFTDAVEILLLP